MDLSNTILFLAAPIMCSKNTQTLSRQLNELVLYPVFTERSTHRCTPEIPLWMEENRKEKNFT